MANSEDYLDGLLNSVQNVRKDVTDAQKQTEEILREKQEQRKEVLRQIEQKLNKKYGAGTVILTLQEQYRNMREKIEPVHYIIDIAKQAMQELNIKPLIVPIRGGTDGARLSFMGLPTPNLFTGGHNFHGRYEYIPVYAMEKAVQLIIRIAELCTKI